MTDAEYNSMPVWTRNQAKWDDLIVGNIGRSSCSSLGYILIAEKTYITKKRAILYFLEAMRNEANENGFRFTHDNVDIRQIKKAISKCEYYE